MPCLVWVTSASMNSRCAISPAIYQKGQHQWRWSQVIWLHYNINNLSDYKWSVVAASDIAVTAHCKEEEKKVDFSITEKFQLPRHLRALKRYKWCRDGTAINQFTQSDGQHKWQEKPALRLTWRPNSDWTFLFPAFRAVCIMKALCFQSSIHTVSSPSQAASSAALSLTTWSRDSCLKSSGASILSVSFLCLDLTNFLSDLMSHFCLPHTEQFQLLRFLLTLKIVQASYMSQEKPVCAYPAEKCRCYCCSYPSQWACSTGWANPVQTGTMR